MSDAGPTRTTRDLADVVELLLDKGVVVNADIAVTVGETELLGVHIKAAIASFETAAKYGLEFPEGTDRDRVEEAAGLTADERSSDDEDEEEARASAGTTRSPANPESPDRVAVRPHAVPTVETGEEATESGDEEAETGDAEAGESEESSDEEVAEAAEPDAGEDE